MKTFQWEDIKTNNDEKSCWIVIKNQVYDVTKFLNEHPGGNDVILNKGGQDASTEFQNVGHSTDAYDQLKQFKIGVTDGSINIQPEFENKTLQQLPILVVGILIYILIYVKNH